MVPGQIALMRMPRGAYSQGGAAGQADHAVLGGVVGGAAGQADQPAEGGAVDDRAAALFAHLGQLVLHAGPHPAEVDGVDPVEDLGGLVGGVAGRDLDAGVVERHVEPAEGVDGRVTMAATLSSSATSHGTPEHAWPAAVSSSVGGVERGLVDVGEDDRGAGFGERAGGGQAHPGAGAGDEGTWPVKS